MSLRIRLLFSYLTFTAFMAAIGLWCVFKLQELGEISRKILANNYDSVVAAQEMKESLERQDSAAVIALLGQLDRARSQLQENRSRFDAANHKAAANITEPGESGVIEAILQEKERYYRLCDSMLQADAAQGPKDRRSLYFKELEPAFHRLRARCQDLLDLNQRAMLSKSDQAAGVARRSLELTFGLGAALVLAGLALSYQFAKRIVRPIQELMTVTKRLAGGDLTVRAVIPSHDEVGLLAAEINRMAERLRQLRSADLDRLLLAQRTTEAALDSLLDPVVITDADGNITKLNPPAEKIFGSENTNEGKPLKEIARDVRIGMAVSEALDQRRPVANDAIASAVPIRLNGTEHVYRLRTTPLRDEQGDVLGAVMLMDDITRLRDLDRFKSEFIDMAATKLRTPLINVETSVHLILEGAAGELNEQQQDLLYDCREECGRLSAVIRDLLALSRLESSQDKPILRSIDLHALLEEIRDSLRPQIEAADLGFSFDLAEPLSSVIADADYIRRILENLVSNAIRYTSRGGEITLRAESQSDGVALVLSDTGKGIPSEMLPRIFDRFVIAPEKNKEGSGLGLAITKRLVEAQGGQISVRSYPGHGTVFTVFLPMDPRTAALEIGR